MSSWVISGQWSAFINCPVVPMECGRHFTRWMVPYARGGVINGQSSVALEQCSEVDLLGSSRQFTLSGEGQYWQVVQINFAIKLTLDWEASFLRCKRPIIFCGVYAKLWQTVNCDKQWVCNVQISGEQAAMVGLARDLGSQVRTPENSRVCDHLS